MALLHRVESAAAEIGVGRSTVYELIAKGDLKTVHIGRRALITDESLRAFVDRLVQHGAA